MLTGHSANNSTQNKQFPQTYLYAHPQYPELAYRRKRVDAIFRNTLQLSATLERQAFFKDTHRRGLFPMAMIEIKM